MNFFFAFTDPLKNIGREIVVFQVVEAAFDHLAQVERFGAASLSGKEIETLLGFGGKSDGGGHVNTCIQCITANGCLQDEMELRRIREGAEILIARQEGNILVEAGLGD